jgi:hypothetical protein
VDLQNGIFEEDGLKMLEKWEKESTIFLMGENKGVKLLDPSIDDDILDLNKKAIRSDKQSGGGSSNYDSFFK